MAYRSIIEFDEGLLVRRLDPTANGTLRVDTPDYWGDNTHALTSLALSPIIHRNRFDRLPEDNKFIVAALVEHLLKQISVNYIRKEVPRGFEKTFLSNYRIMFVVSEELWKEVIRLAGAAKPYGSIIADPPSRDLMNLIVTKNKTGEIVKGDYLEDFMEFGKPYLDDSVGFGDRRPIYDNNDLDGDDMHAFLCAYVTAFHR
jgi:hypothetical protein